MISEKNLNLIKDRTDQLETFEQTLHDQLGYATESYGKVRKN